MRSEFVIQRAHRFSYDQAYRVPGGVLVEISGDPINLQPGDEKIVATRLREELLQRRTA